MTKIEASLTYWAEAQREALTERNALVALAAEQGMTQRAIGALVGLSHTAVARICREARS